MAATSKADITEYHSRLRRASDSRASRDIEWRRRCLNSIKQAFEDHYDEAVAAVRTDLGRSVAEAQSEILTIFQEIDDQLRNLSSWMQPEPRKTHMLLLPGHTEVRREPYGVTLVIGPYNYPFNLCVVPVVGALAAGNTVVLKPSENTPSVTSWMARRLHEYVSPDALRVVLGSVSEMQALLQLKWDFIFFTGSATVGRIVSKAAAEHLTPTVMELGGKAPVLIDKSVGSLREAAKRTVQGKFLNAGQTCMAPNYVMCHRSVHVKFLEEATKCVEEFFGADPEASADYGRSIDSKHAERMQRLIQGAGGTIKCGGVCKAADRYVAPTIIDLPDENSEMIRGGELFGPILPVLVFDDLDDAISRIKAYDAQPLAAYIFATNRKAIEKVLNEVQSGDAVVNDTFIHAINPTSPFGGVGTSGHGTYKGRYSYETFTYQRGVMFRHGWLCLDQTVPANLRYPPSNFLRLRLLPHVVRYSPFVHRIPWLKVIFLTLAWALYRANRKNVRKMAKQAAFKLVARLMSS